MSRTRAIGMTDPYPHLFNIKTSLRRHGIQKMASSDSSFVKLECSVETPWRVIQEDDFISDAARCIAWLRDHSKQAWRYAAQSIIVDSEEGNIAYPRTFKVLKLRHRVQFRNRDDALLFKLSI